MQVKTLDDYYE
jgi:hypothetical protein